MSPDLPPHDVHCGELVLRSKDCSFVTAGLISPLFSVIAAHLAIPLRCGSHRASPWPPSLLSEGCNLVRCKADALSRLGG